MPPKNPEITVAGTVTDLFAHRFVLATPHGKMLADLGPKGADEVRLAVGDEVTLSGEKKPSELKVHALTRKGRDYRLKHGHAHDLEDAAAALAALRAIGFEPSAPPERKPKHFEILARRGDETLRFHVEFDGSIRKTKPAS